MGVSAGDMYAVPIADGRYTALRILATSTEMGEELLLVAFCPWLGPLPVGTEPELGEVLARHQGNWGGRPAVFWFSGRLPKEFIALGSVPLVAENEAALIKEAGYRGIIGPGIGGIVVRELDPDSLESVAGRRAPSSKREDKECGRVARALFPEREFWDVISLVRCGGGDWESSIQGAVDRLSEYTSEQIVAFEALLRTKLFLLDRQDIASEIGSGAYGTECFSPDHFLDARCGIVALGRDVYEAALLDPASVPEVAEAECEELLSVASAAFLRKVGRPLPDDGLLDVDTFSNKAGWGR